MALAALANLAAAVTAGYSEVVIQTPDTNFFVTLEKWVTGGAGGGSGSNIRAYGVGSTQNTAEVNAVAALNFARGVRYGFDTGVCSTINGTATAHTRDVT